MLGRPKGERCLRVETSFQEHLVSTGVSKIRVGLRSEEQDFGVRWDIGLCDVDFDSKFICIQLAHVFTGSVVCYKLYFRVLWELPAPCFLLHLSNWTPWGIVFYNSSMFVLLCVQIVSISRQLPLESIPRTIRMHTPAVLVPRQEMRDDDASGGRREPRAWPG